MKRAASSARSSGHPERPASGLRSFVYDAAVLVAADRNERRAWAEHKARSELGGVLLVPAPVVAQVSRSPQQVQLRRFLAGCMVVPLDETGAHEPGGSEYFVSDGAPGFLSATGPGHIAAGMGIRPVAGAGVGYTGNRLP